MLRELALFAGAGGGILGGRLLGWRTVCAVEIDAYRRARLLDRQRDGMLPRFPIWDDVRSFDGQPWRGAVDVISGGFPCQDISSAGKGAGIEGERSGLWAEFARIIREVRPRYALVENSPMLTSRGLDRVLGDLAELGFDAEWGVLGADDAGAPHRRKRIWIVADADCRGFQGKWEPQHADEQGASRRLANGCRARGRREWAQDVHDADCGRHQPPEVEVCPGRHAAIDAGWWATEPGLGRVADGVANRVDRLKAIGDGQVPAVVALAWTVLSGGIAE